ncbi:hypothetical protein E1A91_A11G174500v1 [Gossypium mustelinum]|nr:hypothetical protein E1A91_A11G174500v1 [Gossypium mustelinum]
MADALVSVVVNIILDNLNSLFLEEMGLAGSLKKELQSLESTLTTIQAVLHDAEEKQWKSEAIKNWLGKLKQAAYDLEDVLDDFKTKAQRRRSKNCNLEWWFNLMSLPSRVSSLTALKTLRMAASKKAVEQSLRRELVHHNPHPVHFCEYQPKKISAVSKTQSESNNFMSFSLPL